MSFDNNKNFYDNISSFYDEMISFHKRFKNEEADIKAIVDRYKIHSAIDAGCGTGFHSFILSKLGVETIAIDSSARMIKKLKHNSKKLKLKVNTIQSRLEDMTNKISTPVDAIFCLGNTLANIQSQNNLNRVLGNFNKLLKPSGILILQFINYDGLLVSKERILNIKKEENKLFIRFYDYGIKKINFNILCVDLINSSFKYNLQTTTLRPIYRNKFLEILKKHEFVSIKSYGSLKLEKYYRVKSKDLVTIAKKIHSRNKT